MHSPVTWRAIWAGARAAGGGDEEADHARLARLIAQRYSARDVLLTNSGTSALRLAIAGSVATGSGPVALPGYGCYDLASAAEGAESGVVLYDVDPDTLGPDLGSLRAACRLRPAAVVVAHLFGHVADIRSASGVAGGALMIEDAAQGVGGELEGRSLGSFGSLAVLSFGRGKGITGGGGGALLAHDDRGIEVVEWAQKRIGEAARGVSQLLALSAQMLLGRPLLYGIPAALPFLHLGETTYHPPASPRELPAASRAVLSSIWDAAQREVVHRRQNAQRLAAAMERSRILSPARAPTDASSGWLRLPATVRRGPRAEALTPDVLRLGVAPGYPTTLTALPTLRARLAAESRLPGAAILADSLVTIPTHRLLSLADLAALEAWIARP